MVEDLKNKIIKANNAYRIGNSIMSDIDYDELLEQYKKYVSDEEYNIFIRTLHEKAGKVKLPYLLGSLNKLKCQEPITIQKFVSKYAINDLHISAKVDGISTCLVYKNGSLTHAMTRGDGTFGESLDDKIRFVNGIIFDLPENLDIVIRGELVILKSDFETMEGTNPRNVCAGIMNRKTTSKEWNNDDLKKITFIPYSILGNKYSKQEQFDILTKFGFKTSWYTVLSGQDYNLLKNDAQALSNILFKYATQNLAYEIDGVVVSSTNYHNEDKYYPDAQAAVKTNTMSTETVLLDVSWDGPSKHGFFIPVAVLAPVELGGATISRATLHNLDIMENLNVMYGSNIEILKGGDIIPQVVRVIENTDKCKSIIVPTECSCCGSKLIRDGVNLRCINKNCRVQKIYQIEHFIKNLNVMNASYKTLNNFGIDSYEKLLAFVPNLKKLSEKKLVEEFKNKIFTRSPQDIFTALDIQDVGETLQKKIIEYYGWENIKNPEYNFDIGLPFGIGEITLTKFKDARIENLNILNMIIKDIRYTWTEKSIFENKKIQNIKGSICFTGALSISRGEASNLAEAAGFEIKNAVTKGLTYLVTPDPNSGSSKNEKAKKYGTKVIDEKTFMNLIKTTDDSIMDF